MFHCFSEEFAEVSIDQEPRKFGHKLTNHPSLSLGNISRLILAHPKERVAYSKGLLTNGDDFENAKVEHHNGMSIEETIETIRTSNSYIYLISDQPQPHE